MLDTEDIGRVHINENRQSLRYEASVQEDEIFIQTRPHSSTEFLRIGSPDDYWSSKYHYLVCSIIIGSSNDLFPLSMKLAFQLSGGAFMLVLLFFSVIIGLPLIYMETFFGRYTKLTNCQMYRMAPIFFGLGLTVFAINVLYRPEHVTNETQILVSLLQLLANPSINEKCLDTNSGCYDYMKKGKVNDNCKYGYISIICEKLGEIRYIMEHTYWKMYKDPTTSTYPYYQMIIAVAFTWILILIFVMKRLQVLGWIVHIAFITHISILTLIFILALSNDGSFKGLNTLATVEFKNFNVYQLLFVEWYSLCRLGLIIPTGFMTSSAYARFKTSIDTDCLTIVFCSLILTGFYFVIFFSVCGVIAEAMGVDIDTVFVPGTGLYLTVVPQFMMQLQLPNGFLIFYYGSLWFFETAKAALYIHMLVLNLYDYFPSLKNFANYIWVSSCLIMCFASIPLCNQKYKLDFIPTVAYIYLNFGLGIFITLEVTMVSYFYGIGRLSNDICFQTGQIPMRFWRIMWYLIPWIGWYSLIRMATMTNQIQAHSLGHSPNELGWLSAALFFVAVGILAIISTVMYISFRIGTPNLFLSLLKPQYIWGPPGRAARMKRKAFCPQTFIRSQGFHTGKTEETTYYREAVKNDRILISQFSLDILKEQATRADILKDKIFFERIGLYSKLDYGGMGVDDYSVENEQEQQLDI